MPKYLYLVKGFGNVEVRIDSQGRIYLPAHIRNAVKHKRFRVVLEGDRIILIPIKPAIEKYYGIVKPRYKTAKEIDEAVKHETEKILREDIH